MEDACNIKHLFISVHQREKYCIKALINKMYMISTFYMLRRYSFLIKHKQYGISNTKLGERTIQAQISQAILILTEIYSLASSALEILCNCHFVKYLICFIPRKNRFLIRSSNFSNC